MNREAVVLARSAATPRATQFRSTWLRSSIEALRSRGRWETYLQHLPPEHHEAIELLVVGVWLPIEIAEAHYAACDALGLPDDVVLEIGREVTKGVHGTVLDTAVKLAKVSGVTPWSILERLDRIWARTWVGGGVAVERLGPKAARIVVHRWSPSRFRYTRVAMRGVIGALLALFCRTAYVHEVPSMMDDETLAYRVEWA